MIEPHSGSNICMFQTAALCMPSAPTTTAASAVTLKMMRFCHQFVLTTSWIAQFKKLPVEMLTWQFLPEQDMSTLGDLGNLVNVCCCCSFFLLHSLCILEFGNCLLLLQLFSLCIETLTVLLQTWRSDSSLCALCDYVLGDPLLPPSG